MPARSKDSGDATANFGRRARRLTLQNLDDDDAEFQALQKRLDLSIGLSVKGSAPKIVLAPCSASAGSRRTCATNGSSSRPSRATPVASSSSGFATCAESLLPATPGRSQFLFELPNPLMMHSKHEENKHLQRRLSMLGALQAETVKLEKKQRMDGRAANMFYKLSDEGSAPSHLTATAGGCHPTATWRSSHLAATAGGPQDAFLAALAAAAAAAVGPSVIQHHTLISPLARVSHQPVRTSSAVAGGGAAPAAPPHYGVHVRRGA